MEREIINNKKDGGSEEWSEELIKRMRIDQDRFERDRLNSQNWVCVRERDRQNTSDLE